MTQTALISPRLSNENQFPIFRRVLGVHVSGHDAGLAIVEDGRVLEIIEFERVFRDKRCYIFPNSSRFDKSLEWAFDSYNMTTNFDLVVIHLDYFSEELFDLTVQKLKKYVPHAHYLQLNHHLCHAASGYFTSPFKKASILSYDGWGNDGATVSFLAEGNNISYLKVYPYRLGKAYRALGSIIGGIHEPYNNTAGKTMGLTAYGQVIENWKKPINDFIRNYRPMREQVAPWEPTIADGAFILENFGPVMGANTFGGPENKASQDFAATFQQCWSEIVLEIVREIIDQTGCSDVCIVGGSALNAITNYEIIKTLNINRIHFIPNSNDSGIAMGAALYGSYTYQNIPWNGYGNQYFQPYIGIPVLDANEINDAAIAHNAVYLENSTKYLAELLATGKIVGVIQSRSEVGPRALGNRSILCDPRISNMKEVINQGIKGREWYRPYAPVVRQEDQSEYFDIEMPVPYMSVIGFVHPQWRNQIPAVTHVDGSARLQTVSHDQNRFLWELLRSFKEITGIGVLLNTSFNGRGEPIISTLKDALRLLTTTKLDAVYCEGWLFTK